LDYKQLTFEKEKRFLSKYAQFSDNQKRERPLSECNIRTDFQRDRDRIIHSKSFRRLKHKTQVFLSPEDDHYRTRLTHTLEVNQIARTIARGLNLNEDLTEAIALGHDLGHTPFGHCGENTLASLTEGYFEHNKQSLRVVKYLENDFLGLNLTLNVEDGILNHKLSGKPKTLEGRVVSLADRIAYLNHDIDDSIRAKVLKPEDLPKDLLEVLGATHKQRINTMVLDILDNSFNKDFAEMSKKIADATSLLRDFMFKNVYENPDAKKEEKKAVRLIETLYEYFFKDPKKIPKPYHGLLKSNPLHVVICDYISGFTDRYAISLFNDIFVPKAWQ
jgi:dGTPase